MEDVQQIVRLLVLAVPVAWAAWTVTHEEVFRELREYCVLRSRAGRGWVGRKLFYLFTCEYCLSHWWALLFQLFFGFRMAFEDWRGYLVSLPALVGVANVYMTLYQRTRVDLRRRRALADRAESQTRKGTV